ncbi:XrtA/PEP-CTERM system histidine kinase PrsK [Roseococcus pinisoli]|uniref:histidine kinase n=1 Tax=Roseococcus pinisoli TaxID=2835040 RepID=A0ABS5QEB4_9PROT|nr:XrtA/PEP-CTERM system histidine kinase PrsK [Roseococcus pinisoli]MBS7812039.1 PEP-CTERM system histidine kinase PrsK [Roseococcus pinisoli]
MIATASPILHAGSAAICLAWIVLILVVGRGSTALVLALACLATAAWAAAVALAPSEPLSGTAAVLEVLRSAVWCAVLLWLARRFGNGWSSALMWRFSAAAALLTVLALVALLPGTPSFPTLGSPGLLARLGLALLVLVVAENLWRNAEEGTRWHVVMPCIALGLVSAFDVLLHADAALSRGYSPALLDGRAAVAALAMPLLVVAAARDRRWRRDPPVSRQAVFHGTTFILAGTFLLGVGAAGEVLRHLGADWTRAAQASLLAGGVMVLAVAAGSRSARSWLRARVVDHFFTARFDYRREWLRCIRTLSGHAEDPQRRAVIAIADPVDSPAGLLFLRDPENGRLSWAGAWNMPKVDLSPAADQALLAALGEGERIATEVPVEVAEGIGPLWLAVPLYHHLDGLMGVVLLAPPRAAFALDGEVFDLLRAVGRAVAMFLAERRAAERLRDQRDLQDYARRFAFVAHDVKTVAHQLSMLHANAEHHMDDPEFQADLLTTVGAAAARIATLVARLRNPEAEESLARVAPLDRLRTIARNIGHAVEIRDQGAAECRVPIAAGRFDAALRHLLDNAAEASPPDVPVWVTLRQEEARLVLDITDRGPGMSAEFVRDTLFRPLSSGRAGGNGIGAWQARDLLRGAGGDIDVITAPGRGTTMRVTLPCLPAAELVREVAA